MALSKMINLGMQTGKPTGTATILASKYIQDECHYIFMTVGEVRGTFMEMARSELDYLEMYRYDMKRRTFKTARELVEFTEEFFS